MNEQNTQDTNPQVAAPTVKPPAIDLKAVYAVLSKAYLRNHPHPLEATEEEEELSHA